MSLDFTAEEKALISGLLGDMDEPIRKIQKACKAIQGVGEIPEDIWGDFKASYYSEVKGD